MEIRPIVSALLRSKTGAVLVAAQVAMTLAIVCNALFVVQARLGTARRPSGVDEPNVFQIKYASAAAVVDATGAMLRDLEALRAIPGVRAAADVNSMPLSASGWGVGLTVDPQQSQDGIEASVYFSGASMIDALGLRLALGRAFTAADVRVLHDGEDLSSDVVIVSSHLARKLLPDAPNPLGKTVYLGAGADAKPMRIVGVVDRLIGPWGQTSDDAYDSFLLPVRYLSSTVHYAVRTEPGQRDRVMAAAEKALGGLQPGRVLVSLRSMDTLRARRYRHELAGASILVAVTIGLLLVTASGIVGVASLWVSQRRKQIGVRRALGARRRDILRYFVTENVLITTTGIAIGVALALGLNQYLASHVELARLPVTYVVAGMLGAWVLGVIAVLGPAWRAASVPPAVATRSA